MNITEVLCTVGGTGRTNTSAPPSICVICTDKPAEAKMVLCRESLHCVYSRVYSRMYCQAALGPWSHAYLRTPHGRGTSGGKRGVSSCVYLDCIGRWYACVYSQETLTSTMFSVALRLEPRVTRHELCPGLHLVYNGIAWQEDLLPLNNSTATSGIPQRYLKYLILTHLEVLMRGNDEACIHTHAASEPVRRHN